MLAVVCLSLSSGGALAGWLDDRLDDVKKIAKKVPKVANPLQTQIDIVRGKKTPDQAIKDFVRDQGQSIGTITNSSRNIVTSVDNSFEHLASSIGGDFGKVVYEISTGGQRFQNEFVFSAGTAAAAVMQGQDPLLSLAMPLAAAIRDARNKHINNARRIPAELRELFEPVIPKHILDRARYTIGDLKISLPSVITSANKMFGDDYAVVVDDVIVFVREPDLNDEGDIEWWAHELHHVYQYEEWGVDLFAYRYAKHWSRVEAEAEQSAKYVMSYIGQLGSDHIQPSMSMAGMVFATPKTINTPPGTDYSFYT